MGHLDIETTLARRKQLSNVIGKLVFADAPVRGYEIHHGETISAGLSRPLAFLGKDARPDGAISADGQVMGTYLHGLFDEPAAARSLLAWSGRQPVNLVDAAQVLDASINRLSAALDKTLDWERAGKAGFQLESVRQPARDFFDERERWHKRRRNMR